MPANVRAFMAEYYETTQESPIYKDERIWGGMRCILHCEVDGDMVLVEGIRTVFRGKGFGSAGLKWLCRLADAHGVVLSLSAYPFGRTEPRLNKQQLLAWYRRHGFHGHQRLTRLPQKPETTLCQNSIESPLLPQVSL